MLQLRVTIWGKAASDIEEALREASRKVDQGYLSGHDENDSGGYSFTVSGHDESEED